MTLVRVEDNLSEEEQLAHRQPNGQMWLVWRDNSPGRQRCWRWPCARVAMMECWRVSALATSEAAPTAQAIVSDRDTD